MTVRSRLPRYDAAPDVASGLILRHVALWAVVPEATTNLVINPSVEQDTTGYNAVGSTITRVASQQRRGAYSLQVTPNIPAVGGVWYGNITTVSGTTYTFSVDFKGKAGIWYQVYIGDGSGNVLGTQYRFRATGQWQRVSATWKENSSTQRKLFMYKDAVSLANQDSFYVDGLQLEAKAYPTTYCDGDQQGTVIQVPPAYQWQGLAHASSSSRRAESRHGGHIVSLADVGLQITGIAGLGMANPSNVLLPYALSDGGNYQRTLFQDRVITVAGTIHGTGVTDLERKKQALYELLSRDTAADQPVRFFMQVLTDKGYAVTDLLEFHAVYAGGLDGNITNPYQENVTIKLALDTPLIQSSYDAGATLAAPVTASASLVKRSGPHQYTTLASLNAAGIIYAMAYNPVDGRLYVGGEFTSPATRLFAIDLKDNSIATFGTGANGTVYALAIESDGTVAIGGAFTTLNGVAVSRIGYYTLGTGVFSQLGSGANGSVYALAREPDTNTMIIGGAFTTLNGATSQRVATYTSHASITTYNPGFDNDVNAIQVLTAGPTTGTSIIFLGGAFTTWKGTANQFVTRTDLSSGSLGAAASMGSFDNPVYAIEADYRGLIYVGGRMTTFNSTSLSPYVMAWNNTGQTMTSVGNGTDTVAADFVRVLTSDSQNNIYIGGDYVRIFLVPRTISTPDKSLLKTGGLTVFNKSSITVFESVVNDVYALYVDPSDNLYFGLTNTSTVGTKTTITYTGTAKTYPRLRIKVSSATDGCFILTNATTGKMFVLKGPVYNGSTLYHTFTSDMYIDFDPDSFTAYAVDGTDLRQYILPQSNIGEMYLVPGANDIYVVHGSGSMTYSLSWRTVYQSASDAVP